MTTLLDRGYPIFVGAEMESSLSKRISELLYHYDCVILPELGGFVTNYRPARKDDSLHLIHPPRKDVSFNRDLNNNDGLLANALSREEDISHEEANARIKKEVEAYCTELNEGRKVVFDKVGILYTDKNDKWRFSPDDSINYLLDSFGLKKVYAVPVKKSVPERVIRPVEEKKVKEPVIVAPVVPPSKKVEPEKEIIEESTPVIAMEQEPEEEEGSNSRLWLAALIPLLLYMGVVGYQSDVVNDGTVTVADLNIFSDSVEVDYSPRDEKWDLNLDIEEIPPLRSEVNEDRPFDSAQGSPIDSEQGSHINSNEIVVSEGVLEESDGMIASIADEASQAVVKVAPAIPMTTYVAPSEISHQEFHVVAGCFSVENNAQKMVDRLRGQGFDSYIIDKRKGLHRVIYGSFDNRTEAVTFLNRIKEENDEAAWLLRKR